MKSFLQLLMCSVVCLGLSACGGNGVVGGATSPLVQSTSFHDIVDHPYFPTDRGVLLIYEGDKDGEPVREEVRTLRDTRHIAGVDCTAVEEHIYVGGELVEITTEWFAQDTFGNVWKFGEESRERQDDGSFIVSTDTWIAHPDGIHPWLAFPAQPVPGEVYYGASPDGVEEFHVISVTDTVPTPAGTFTQCLNLVENPDDPDDTDIILYARGVGRVSESNQSGNLILVARSRD